MHILSGEIDMSDGSITAVPRNESRGARIQVQLCTLAPAVSSKKYGTPIA